MPDTSSVDHLVRLLRLFTMETERYISAFGTDNEMHRTDLNALGAIMEAGQSGDAMTPGRLSRRLQLSAPATSALLDRLESAGHVRRVRSTVDRRRVDLELTDTALDVGRALFAPLAKHLRPAIERYPAEQRALVAEFLTEVAAATRAAADGSTDATATKPRK
ncbi:MarR family winged helix-turn-helix transcriptional regulator [Labedaea rhizosphaerae]|uniref:MarR family protein n=1 Tax=Labedaea rhizosphaerae TaxID=598644 RepID=A0A4R6SE96_LABRH|nr:MarR family transcriptional regulator [Labedaea rhizosphaerae]TDP97973.1 MarR family protein [Labedaea rhizosphaerae]